MTTRTTDQNRIVSDLLVAAERAYHYSDDSHTRLVHFLGALEVIAKLSESESRKLSRLLGVGVQS